METEEFDQSVSLSTPVGVQPTTAVAIYNATTMLTGWTKPWFRYIVGLPQYSMSWLYPVNRTWLTLKARGRVQLTAQTKFFKVLVNFDAFSSLGSDIVPGQTFDRTWNVTYDKSITYIKALSFNGMFFDPAQKSIGGLLQIGIDMIAPDKTKTLVNIDWEYSGTFSVSYVTSAVIMMTVGVAITRYAQHLAIERAGVLTEDFADHSYELHSLYREEDQDLYFDFSHFNYDVGKIVR